MSSPSRIIRLTINVTELGEKPVILTMSAGDVPRSCLMMFSRRRSLASRRSDFFHALRFVSDIVDTPGVKSIPLGQ